MLNCALMRSIKDRCRKEGLNDNEVCRKGNYMERRVGIIDV